MKGNEYQELAARTISKNLYDYEVEQHALHGMVGEIGEIHSLYQKVYQDHVFDETHLKLEVGDLLWFIAEFCTAHGWDLDEIMELNINKLMNRYPDGFDEEKSKKRMKGDM